MDYSYKNGYAEGVVFCFYDNGKILLEDRGLGFENEAFYPNGSIEQSDKKLNRNYVKAALYREVEEEFDGRIIINNEKFIGEILVPEIKVHFYIYLIVSWDGEFPSVIKEPNEVDSNLKFFSFEDAKNLFKYSSALEILDLVKDYLKNNSYSEKQEGK